MAALLLGILAIGSFARTRAPAPSPRAAAAAAATIPLEGPRAPGSIEATPIELPQPAYNQNDDLCQNAQSAWTFPGATATDVQNRLERNGFDAATRESLGRHLRCDAQGCALDAPDPLLLSLPAGPRGRLYRELGAFRGQIYAVIPYHRPRAFPPWEQVAPSPRARELFTRLSWVEGETQYFADLPTACRALTDRGERVAFLSLLRRRYSLDVRVRVPAELSPEAVVRYWTLPGRPVDPARVARVRDAQGHAQALSLRDLLDGWTARRVNEYPTPAEPERDCFWTTQHFGADLERDAAPTTEQFAGDLARTWREIPRAELRYGDAVVLHGATLPEHAMVFLADDLVFTKNGRSRSRAWVVARLPEVLLDYPRIASVRAYRPR